MNITIIIAVLLYAILLSSQAFAQSDVTTLSETTDNSSIHKQSDFSNNNNLYVVRPDYRECLEPVCGGWFVKKLNRKKTSCADGTRQAECYIASVNAEDFDFSSAPVPAFENQAPYIFRGHMSLKMFEGIGSFGVFHATDIFQSVSDQQASGRFFGLEDLGILCVTSPCFSYEASVLNRKRIIDISGYDFSLIDAEIERITAVEDSLDDGQTVLLSGKVFSVNERAGKGRHILATQLYQPLKPSLVITECLPGYSYSDGGCRTEYGCEYPLIELTGIGGAPIIDPVTGEVSSVETKSCVTECEFPAQLISPAQCVIYYP